MCNFASSFQSHVYAHTHTHTQQSVQVGKAISTKLVGSSGRTDVTLNYKFEEGSEQERATLSAEEVDKASEIELEVAFSQQASIGEDFDVTAKVRSNISHCAITLLCNNLVVFIINAEILYTHAHNHFTYVSIMINVNTL